MSVKVSVCMITYNHERFIAQAVESALMQETDFEYEIVVGEDCSTDGTRQVLLELRDRYPDKIRLLLHESNIGGGRNFVHTFGCCDGEYVALLEGDDYWTCPQKLQKQVDLLDRQKDVSICGHRVEMRSEHDPAWRGLWPLGRTKDLGGLEDAVRSCYLPACSRVFRKEALDPPTWFADVKCGDWVILALTAQHGGVAFIDEVLGVRRIHDGGIWSGATAGENILAELETMDRIDGHLGGRFRRQLAPIRRTWRLRYGWWAFSSGERLTALGYGIRLVCARPWLWQAWKLVACAILKNPQNGDVDASATAGRRMTTSGMAIDR